MESGPKYDEICNYSELDLLDRVEVGVVERLLDERELLKHMAVVPIDASTIQ